MKPYAEFLKAKVQMAKTYGFEISFIPVHFLQAPFGSVCLSSISHSTTVSGLASLTPSYDAVTLKERYPYAFLYGAGLGVVLMNWDCLLWFPVPAPPFSGPDGSIRKDSKFHSYKRYNNIRPFLFLTSSCSGGILRSGAEYTLYCAVAIPTASGLFSCLIVFYGWGAPNRKAGGMAQYMYSTPHPPYALNKQKGGDQSHCGVDAMPQSALMPVEPHGTTISLINRDGMVTASILAGKHGLKTVSSEYVRNHPFHENYQERQRYCLKNGAFNG